MRVSLILVMFLELVGCGYTKQIVTTCNPPTAGYQLCQQKVCYCTPERIE